MLENQDLIDKNYNDSTIVFCIDTSGSMNITSTVEGKVDLKYGISQQEIDMLKQFMDVQDYQQLIELPGVQNHNKTFVSRKQCILSAIQSQIDQLKKSSPQKKIGFATFNNEVTILGDSSSQTVNIVGDKLYNKEAIITSLQKFKLNDPICKAHQQLIKQINKVIAKQQTALGPAIVSALQIAGKGSPGSSVILCPDRLANIGIGQLEPYDEQKKKFYAQLGQYAKNKNISVSIITIKGEGCKIQAIGQLAQKTNGNIKIVNPQKLSDDFANVLKDQVVGLNVLVRVLLHKGMQFKNEKQELLKQKGCILQKQISNATKNTRISFQYQIKHQKQLQNLKIQIDSLKELPFQAQIQYTSPNGGKFLRVITNVCSTTQSQQQVAKKANFGVVHQRITNKTAMLYQQGDYKGSVQFNNKWVNFLGDVQGEDHKQEFKKFAVKNEKLNKAIRHRHRKSIQKKIKQQQILQEDEIELIKNHSDIQSDEDQRQLVDNLMQRQCYSIERKASLIKSNSSSQQQKKPKLIPLQKKQRKKSIEKPRKKSIPKKRKQSFCDSDSD